MNYTTHQQRSVDLFRRALLVGLGAQLLMPEAFAQQQSEDEAKKKKAEELETQTVTGTRLTGSEVEGTFSVDLYKTDSVINQGYVSQAEMLRRKVPQFGGGVGTVNEGFGNGGDGSASISLRNLPGDRTLTLFNGRRTTADLNLLPQLALAGTEILNDGASSIYGSDAVAGVVNFKTRRDFEGVELFSYYGNKVVFLARRGIQPCKLPALRRPGDQQPRGRFRLGDFQSWHLHPTGSCRQPDTAPLDPESRVRGWCKFRRDECGADPGRFQPGLVHRQHRLDRGPGDRRT
jgi:hypothetical protein